MLLKNIRSSYLDRYSYCMRTVLSQYIHTADVFAGNAARIRNSQISFESFFTTSVAVQNGPQEVVKPQRLPLKREVTAAEGVLKSSKKKVKTTISKEFQDFFEQKQCLSQVKNLIPEKLIRRTKATRSALYLVDQDVADQIAKAVQEEVTRDGSFVLEANPGLGILSERLIQSGVQHLRLLEPSTAFDNILENLRSLHHSKISIQSCNLFHLWKIVYQDKLDHGDRVKTILSPLPEQDWSLEPVLKIIGTSTSSIFFKHLVLSIVFQSGIMLHSRPEFYLAIPPSLHEVLTCSREAGYLVYRSLTVFFQLFFDYEMLDKLPRQAFLPWAVDISTKKQKKRSDEIYKLDQEYLYLMKIVPKKDVYGLFDNLEQMQQFWYFVQQHMFSRKTRVIPKLESWIPNCGSRLILSGYDIFTEFGDLTPKQIFNLFKVFIRWPEFPHSSFMSSVEMALLKMEETGEDSIDKSDNIEEETVKDENNNEN